MINTWKFWCCSMFKASAFVQALITSSLLSSPPSWRISIYLLKIKPHHPVSSLKTLNAYQLRNQFKLLSKVLHNQIPTNLLSLIFDTPLPLLPPSPHGTHKVRPSCIRKTQNKWIMLLYIWMVYTYWIYIENLIAMNVLTTFLLKALFDYMGAL